MCYQSNHGVKELHVFVLQHLHVTDQARLRMMRIEHGLRQEIAVSLPFREFKAGRQQIVFLGHLNIDLQHQLVNQEFPLPNPIPIR